MSPSSSVPKLSWVLSFSIKAFFDLSHNALKFAPVKVTSSLWVVVLLNVDAPPNVEIPVTFNFWVSVVAKTVTPYPVVLNFYPLLK